ncbi:hypothetical protein CDL12_20121 [Handroanthus impetiginosus]|uniref:RING-type E3 ubiquitin transferase n=1 Tax=Handroanthus impetiginosus TaxID=429701 RepID=A0A2G9GIK5_9LAMI|nr:hypothetical protein CDL12_22334 [Handroanthus impetiginosus]PIN07317.1 hypothetical protein CDL12_20121 [Handroanthus impetiginosus]
MVTHSVQSLPPPPPYTYPPVTVILTIILLIFFFIGFFSIYFCRCFMQNILVAWHLRHSPIGTPTDGATSSIVAYKGLDPSIVQSFPTFTYSTVKDYRKEKYGLECAICLVEFNSSDVLRLLPPCYHVFHQECIDLWLESHKTCPVCRRNLESPPQSPMKSPIYAGNFAMHHIDENEPIENSVRITIDNEENEGAKRANAEKDRRVTREQGDHAQSTIDKFSRSHSTGHSIVRNRQEEKEDRYTLRLPEHVKSHIIKGHNSSKSWSNFGEYKAKANTRSVGLGEASGGSGGKITNV